MCRHVKEGRGSQACLLWEGNELSQSRKMTYKQVLEEVSRLVSCCAEASDDICRVTALLPGWQARYDFMCHAWQA